MGKKQLWWTAFALAFASHLGAQAPEWNATTSGSGVQIGGTQTLAPSVDVTDGFSFSPGQHFAQLSTGTNETGAFTLLYGLTHSAATDIDMEVELTWTSPIPVNTDIRLRFTNGAPLESQAPDATRIGSIELIGYGTLSDVSCTDACAAVFENVLIDATGVTVRMSLEVALATFGTSSLGCRVDVEPSSCASFYGANCGTGALALNTRWDDLDVVRLSVFNQAPQTFALLGTDQTAIQLPGIACTIYTTFFAAAPLGLGPGINVLELEAPPFDFNMQIAMLDPAAAEPLSLTQGIAFSCP